MPSKFSTNLNITELNLYEDIPSFKSENQDTLGQLFVKFLEHYSWNFNYSQDCASVRVGCTILIETAREHKAIKNTYDQWRFISIEEPFDQTNTAKSVYDETGFQIVLNTFRDSYRTITQTANLASIVNLMSDR